MRSDSVSKGNKMTNEPQIEDDEDDLFDEKEDNNYESSVANDIEDDKEKVDTSLIDSDISNEKAEVTKPKKKKWLDIIIISLVALIMLSAIGGYAYMQFSKAQNSDDQKTEAQQRAEQKKHLDELVKYTQGKETTATIGTKEVKIKILDINQDGSAKASYKEQNKDGDLVNKTTTIDPEVLNSFLQRQKKEAASNKNQNIDNSVNDKKINK